MKQKVIVIIGAEPAPRREIVEALRQEDYLTLAVADESMVLEIARQTPLALIILVSLSIPSVGQAPLGLLSSSPETGHVPVLLLVTDPTGSEHLQQMHPHAHVFTLNPSRWGELHATIHQLLGYTRRPPKVLLIVAQDTRVRESVAAAMKREGHLMLTTADEAAAFEMARDNPVALVIFHPVSLLPANLQYCWQLRASVETTHIPLLLLVANESEITQIVSSGLRVDDFLIRPFAREELRACVHALLRTGRWNRGRKALPASLRRQRAVAHGGEILVVGDFRVDAGRYRVTRGEQEIHLGNSLLFDLFVYLLSHRGAIVTREQILREVWGDASSIESRTVDVHVHWLRQKLHDDPDHPRFIETISGVGYRMKE